MPALTWARRRLIDLKLGGYSEADDREKGNECGTGEHSCRKIGLFGVLLLLTEISYLSAGAGWASRRSKNPTVER